MRGGVLSSALGMALALSVLSGCGETGVEEPEGATDIPLAGGGECRVAMLGRWVAYESVEFGAAGLERCHEVAFEVGDEYCDELRAGASGPNPVTIHYEETIAHIGDEWIFGCEGVPERD